MFGITSLNSYEKNYLSLKKLWLNLLVTLLSVILLQSTTSIRAEASNPVTFSINEKARKANDFVDSICFATHFSYPDTPYGKNFEAVISRMKNLGISYIRDGVAGVSDQKLQAIKAAGIKFIAVSDITSAGNYGVQEIQKFHNQVKQINQTNPNLIAYIEGPNEPDIFWHKHQISYNGSGFAWDDDAGVAKGVTDYMKDLYTIFKSDPLTKDIKIIGPGLGRPYFENNIFAPSSLQNYVDYGNFHIYGGSNPYNFPFTYAGLDWYYNHGTAPSGLIDEYPLMFEQYQPPFGSKTMMATETGYSTNSTTGGINQNVQAKYIPRMFFENFRKNIAKTCSYEFVNEWDKPESRDSNFGILNNDMSSKPAYRGMFNLIKTLQDTTNFNPSNLGYKLTLNMPQGYDRPNFVHHQLLQKANGRFYLAIWHDISNTNNQTNPQTELFHPDIMATITLESQPKEVLVDTIMESGDKWQFTPTLKDNSFNFLIKDKIRIVELQF